MKESLQKPISLLGTNALLKVMVMMMLPWTQKKKLKEKRKRKRLYLLLESYAEQMRVVKSILFQSSLVP